MDHDRVIVRPTAASDAERRRLAELARRRGFSRVALPEAEAEAVGADFVARPDGFAACRADLRPEHIALREVRSPAELAEALAVAATSGGIALRWPADRVIPLESAVAAADRRFLLWVVTDRPAQVPSALAALERGADAVVLECADADALGELERHLERRTTGALDWRRLTVTHVAPAGLGDRIAVDTTSLMDAEEGLLVGSSAAALFHVRSEAVGSAFSRPRPFRVNAGAAHSYVLLADGSTRYLAELEPGDAVLAARPDGPVRPVRVGRLKIERRPLVRIAAESAGRSRTIFVQEAETVRLSTDSGPVASSQIQPGARVWAVGLPPGRHLGQVIDETVEER